MVRKLHIRSRRARIFLAVILVTMAAFLIIRLPKGQVARPAGAEKIPEITRGDGDSRFYEQLIPLFQVKKNPGPYDWLALHEEPGQSFEEFAAAVPRGPFPAGRYIGIVLIGEFDAARRGIIAKTAEFVEAYFGLPVKFLDPVSSDLIPDEARRVHPQTKDRQVLSPYIIENLLIPRKPADAIGVIAFTADDLWPGEGWNFVFGQASAEDRVGVWSIYRNGDPDKSPEDYQLCLLRTLKTGTHEIGHMLGLAHCIYFECNMNGSNHRAESDRRPLALCPVCLRKWAWVTGENPARRMEKLESVCARLGLSEHKMLYRNMLDKMSLLRPVH